MEEHIRRIISTENAPSTKGYPLNQAIILNQMMYVSGVLGINKDTMQLVEGGFNAELRQALTNLVAILKAGDSSLNNVVKVTIFLADINDFASLNRIYEEFFTEGFPARSAFQVGKLPLNATVEIEATAATGTVKTVCCR